VPHPFFALATPIVMGHRGCAGEAPENTLASFARALADGAAVLETDVHLTRDGEPVLIHDDEVDRVTDGSGRVADFDLVALQKLDAAHHFSRDGGRSHPERDRGHRVPSLREVLAAFPGARFNLELKEDLPGLVEETLAAVAEAGRCDTTLVTSGDDSLMRRLRARLAGADPAPALGASPAEVAGFAISALRGGAPPAGPMALQIPTEFAGQPLVTPALVAHAHRHGVQIHVWTIDEEDEMERLLDLGVDGIVTDFPARMVALLARRAG
jgi:glycerophosphoryl diester phosphodiesterase